MPDIQEVIAVGIVALVAGWLLWRRFGKRRDGAKTGDCGDCAAAGPAPKEATVHFYRKRSPPGGANEENGAGT
jgi:ABC-type nickel/cobalt efflux system permease component RcnA